MREQETQLAVIAAMAETIREQGSVPSGHLMVVLASLVAGWGLAQHQASVQVLQRAGLVEVRGNHLLVWVGPKVSA
jgi:hypothetical protein